MELAIFDSLPDGFLDSPATELYQLLPGPSLIHLKGKRPEPVFASILLHGNEVTGLEAIQQLLKNYLDKPLPRSLSIFVGNVEAAQYGQRRLNHQDDFNRVWPAENNKQPERVMPIMQQVVDEMVKRHVFASIDIHNNTGLNPHYGCINRLDDHFFHLATMFSRTVVYFEQPTGVQSMAFAPHCPAVTVECGQPGQHFGSEHAALFIDACLNLDHFPDHPIAEGDMHLFHTVAIMKVNEEVSFGFDNNETDLNLPSDLDHLNFNELPVGTCIGQINHEQSHYFTVCNEQGDDIFHHYFTIDGERIVTKKPLMPSMLTLNPVIIRQDCFCYLMERMSLSSNRG